MVTAVVVPMEDWGWVCRTGDGAETTEVQKHHAKRMAGRFCSWLGMVWEGFLLFTFSFLFWMNGRMGWLWVDDCEGVHVSMW